MANPIRFIDSSKVSKGTKLGRTIYDLHTLRVSLITALATEGGVPISVLSKCVRRARLHPDDAVLRETAGVANDGDLTEAQKRVDREEQRNFVRFLQDHRAEERRTAIATNDQVGIDELNRTEPGTWIVSDRGICPVGGTMCHIGGPKLTINIQASDYATNTWRSAKLHKMPILHHRTSVSRRTRPPFQHYGIPTHRSGETMERPGRRSEAAGKHSKRSDNQPRPRPSDASTR